MDTETQLDSVTLSGWQDDIVKMVDEHESVRDDDRYQGVPELAVNKEISITVILPRGSGHTFLANYLAASYPSVLVYGNRANLIEITEHFELHPESEIISMYEIFYALYKPDIHLPSQEMVEMNKRFATKKLIVVDNALRVPQPVKDYIYGLARGPIVFLGH
jgi:hypothetical protein